MKGIYRAPGPESPPGIPAYWSYSALREWRQCPRRWWLLRAKYAGWEGRYPQRINPAMIAGRLIHDALEAFAGETGVVRENGATYEEVPRAFSVRRFMKGRLKELITEEVDPNPRTDRAQILSKLSIDECVNDFKRVAGTVILPFHGVVPTDSPSVGLSGSGVPEGAERSITVEDPPLTGRLDWNRAGVIHDFKTGEPNPGHAEQLRVYALLVWIAFGLRPVGLEIRYVRTDERVPVAVPSERELIALRDVLRLEIKGANGMIQSGLVPAHSSAEECRWCPVRQHCDAFWSQTSTEPLRWPTCARQVEKEGSDLVSFADVELTDFSDDTSGDGYHGGARAGERGSSAVSLPDAWTPGAGVRPHRVRVLGARIEEGSDGAVVTVTRHSEVFWLA